MPTPACENIPLGGTPHLSRRLERHPRPHPMSSLTLRTKLLFIAALGVIGTLVVGSAAVWIIAQSTSETGTLAMADRALRAQMDADMMHDGISADVYEALLAAREGDTRRQQSAKAALDEDAARILSRMEELRTLTTSAAVLARIDAATPKVRAYVDAAHIAVRADSAGRATVLRDFDKGFAALEVELGALGDAIQGESRAAFETMAASQAGRHRNHADHDRRRPARVDADRAPHQPRPARRQRARAGAAHDGHQPAQGRAPGHGPGRPHGPPGRGRAPAHGLLARRSWRADTDRQRHHQHDDGDGHGVRRGAGQRRAAGAPDRGPHGCCAGGPARGAWERGRLHGQLPGPGAGHQSDAGRRRRPDRGDVRRARTAGAPRPVGARDRHIPR